MADPLRVATLNLWHRSGDWPARRSAVVHHLRALRPDVLALQEVEVLDGPDGVADQAAELADGLGYGVVHGVSVVSPLADGGVRRFGNALLARHPLRAVTRRPLPPGARDEPRSVLHAVVDAPGGPVPVFVTHLAWRHDASADRVRQVVELARVVDELAPYVEDGHPAVLLGDLNAEPDSDEVRYLLGLTARPGGADAPRTRFADAWRYGGDGPGFTYDPVNGHVAGSGEHPRRIDYVLVRDPGDGVGIPSRSRLAFTEPVGGVHASDHFGVVTDLVRLPRR